jgi:hypothetical protein
MKTLIGLHANSSYVIFIKKDEGFCLISRRLTVNPGGKFIPI